MLEPICWILLLGFGGGQLARLPNILTLVGMVIVGMILGPQATQGIVPGMLRLKSLGWGVSKGIPDAVLTGSALSDVLILLVFGLLINLVGEGATQAWYWLPLQVLMQISLGLLCGWVLAQVLVWVLVRRNWTQTLTQDTLVGWIGPRFDPHWLTSYPSFQAI